MGTQVSRTPNNNTLFELSNFYRDFGLGESDGLVGGEDNNNGSDDPFDKKFGGNTDLSEILGGAGSSSRRRSNPTTPKGKFDVGGKLQNKFYSTPNAGGRGPIGVNKSGQKPKKDAQEQKLE